MQAGQGDAPQESLRNLVIARAAGPRALALSMLPLLAGGCERAVGERPLRLVGLPGCPAGASYQRPLVVRLDRERALFEDAWTAQLTLTTANDPAELRLPRRAMRLTLRVGACTATSLGTWDCAAPTWLATDAFEADARAAPVERALPKVTVSCVPVGRAR